VQEVEMPRIRGSVNDQKETFLFKLIS